MLVFASALRTDGSVYTCIATNDIENLLETPESGNAALYVQRKIIHFTIKSSCTFYVKILIEKLLNF